MVEEPIRTIYEPGNQSSHFNPLTDSMKIYFVLLRFSSVSLLTALLDNLVFYFVWKRTGFVLESQVAGRLVAVIFNYSMVRKTVFASREGHEVLLPKYLLLVATSGTASYLGIQFLNARFGVSAMPAKLFVETLLFFVNFLIQRTFIFREAQPGTGPLLYAADSGGAGGAGRAGDLRLRHVGRLRAADLVAGRQRARGVVRRAVCRSVHGAADSGSLALCAAGGDAAGGADDDLPGAARRCWRSRSF